MYVSWWTKDRNAISISRWSTTRASWNGPRPVVCNWNISGKSMNMHSPTKFKDFFLEIWIYVYRKPDILKLFSWHVMGRCSFTCCRGLQTSSWKGQMWKQLVDLAFNAFQLLLMGKIHQTPGMTRPNNGIVYGCLWYKQPINWSKILSINSK